MTCITFFLFLTCCVTDVLVCCCYYMSLSSSSCRSYTYTYSYFFQFIIYNSPTFNEAALVLAVWEGGWCPTTINEAIFLTLLCRQEGRLDWISWGGKLGPSGNDLERIIGVMDFRSLRFPFFLEENGIVQVTNRLLQWTRYSSPVVHSSRVDTYRLQ